MYGYVQFSINISRHYRTWINIYKNTCNHNSRTPGMNLWSPYNNNYNMSQLAFEYNIQYVYFFNINFEINSS